MQWWQGAAAYEVRTFTGGDAMLEDPTTGSLNAGFARWLIEGDMALWSLAIAQGTAIAG